MIRFFFSPSWLSTSPVSASSEANLSFVEAQQPEVITPCHFAKRGLVPRHRGPQRSGSIEKRLQLSVLRIERKMVSHTLVVTKQREMRHRTNENAAMADLVQYPDEKPLRRCNVDLNVFATEREICKMV